MKKRNISDIQNFLYMALLFLLLMLLTKKNMPLDVRFSILTIVSIIFIVIIIIGIKKFIDEYKTLNNSQKLIFFIKQFFIILVVVGYFIFYYMNLKEYLLLR